jgi:hypothetical protein
MAKIEPLSNHFGLSVIGYRCAIFLRITHRNNPQKPAALDSTPSAGKSVRASN